MITPYELSRAELAEQLTELAEDLADRGRSYDSALAHSASRHLRRSRRAPWAAAACVAMAVWVGYEVADGHECMDRATLELEVCP